MLVFYFITDKIKLSKWSSLLSTILVVSSSGLTGYHCFRTGDYESLLVLIYMIQIVSFILLVLEGKRKWLFLLVLTIVAGIYTKGINALFLLPSFSLLFFVFKLNRTLPLRDIVLAAILLFTLGPSYYVSREIIEPGYVAQVQQNELGGRFNHSIDNNKGDDEFYLRFFQKHAHPWLHLVIPLLIIGFSFGTKHQRIVLSLILLFIVNYYVVIHFAQTKTIWYHVPILPMLILLVIVCFQITFERIHRFYPRMCPKYLWILITCLFLPKLFTASKNTLNSGIYPKGQKDFYRTTNFLRENVDNKSFDGSVYLNNNYAAHNWWYIYRMNKAGVKVSIQNHVDSLDNMNKVFLDNLELKEELLNKYPISTPISNKYGVEYWRAK